MDLEYDYNYISSKRKLIVKSVAESYFNLKQAEMNFAIIDKKSLEDYVTQKNEKKKDLSFSRMPMDCLSPVKDYYTQQVSQISEETSTTLFNRRKDMKDIQLNDFRRIKVLGRGSFGKVTLVEYIKTNELFAMKELKKDLLLEEDQIQNTLLEKKILQELEHPFLVNLSFCFQTNERVYFVLPFMAGGELFQHLKNFKHFDEEK